MAFKIDEKRISAGLFSFLHIFRFTSLETSKSIANRIYYISNVCMRIKIDENISCELTINS